MLNSLSNCKTMDENQILNKLFKSPLTFLDFIKYIICII